MNKNYSFSFTISQAEYDNSNIKEYAIQLFRSQFGIDLCSPYLNDPNRVVYIEPKGIKNILNVFLDYGNSDISQVYDKYWSHSQDSINNEYTKYFKSWGIKDTVLYLRNTNICINAALVGKDAYLYNNLYPYLKSNGYDVNLYDLIIIMNMNPGSDICCAWQVFTTPGKGPVNLVCQDFRHQSVNFANYTQADFNLYAFTIYFENVTIKKNVLTSNFTSGIYFIKVKNDKTFEIKKIIKE